MLNLLDGTTNASFIFMALLPFLAETVTDTVSPSTDSFAGSKTVPTLTESFGPLKLRLVASSSRSMVSVLALSNNAKVSALCPFEAVSVTGTIQR